MQPFWLQSNKQKWAYTLIFGLIGVLIFGLIDGLGELSMGLIGVLIFGLSRGLNKIDPVEAIQMMSHDVRRKIYQQLRLWLIGGLIFGLISGLIGGLISGLSGGLIFGLSGGLIGVLIVGLSGGLIGVLIFGLSRGLEVSEVDDKIYPNQGIRKSALNSLLVTLIVGLIVGLSFGLSGALIVGLIVGLSFGPIFGLIRGGKACIQHFSLRIVLFRSGSIPWNYARFLDYCTDRLFLQRVGGRYRFIHKSLQEHFAAMGE